MPKTIMIASKRHGVQQMPAPELSPAEAEATLSDILSAADDVLAHLSPREVCLIVPHRDTSCSVTAVERTHWMIPILLGPAPIRWPDIAALVFTTEGAHLVSCLTKEMLS